MRTQQRSFVVEIKSARRRLKTQPKSIWGNTDFAALVRDTEATLPFLPNANSETPISRENMASDLKKQIEVAEVSEAGGETPRAVPPVDPDKNEQNQQDAVSNDSQAVKVPASEPTRQTVKALKRRYTRRRSVAEDAIAAPSVAMAVDVIGTHSDDLALLSAENLRLKRLLAEQLRHQNAQLRQMLERFGIASRAN
ncbi:hypothetical protein LAV84_27230 [Rhizobium sp. VS19-DR104.2]|uniref:hypothetical protein n=1 Tax=unclassified Rhizobium TaxID=2613769 RepID=UPI001C5BB7DF|nr:MULTISPECIES: hypothetical protein [unclassified Rhizobium]MBZ5763224.1 hypothetical protein [Rhizobium sp. VS19-DR96]MBZ5769178.1 hypothetical protein [Rhizobium sp. VS19-DR129.2]MBZ5776694.1 hypothetical protein [Rhizobium sp. VS19-DRK62.2]MBZ5787811.1 hypothetical protein [Rhizobium sp. VS19-DR121]MBZ5805206.1 hypothetical protein [Rhizobium sp. VS19-DR181]